MSTPQPLPALRAHDGASVFAESAEIEGSLEGDGDVVLKGRVHGSIVITGTLIIGETGRVQADVSAREVVTAGTVEGNIHASERVRVQATGLVQGDIDSPSVIIDDGGGVEGFVQMGPAGASADDDDDASEPRRPAQPAAGLLRRAPSAGPASAPARSWEPSAPAAAAPSQPTVAAQAPAPSAPAPTPMPAPTPTAAPTPTTPSWGASAPAAARPPAAGLLFRPPTQPAAAPSPAASLPPTAPAATGPLVAATASIGGRSEPAPPAAPASVGPLDPFGDGGDDAPAERAPSDDAPIL